jgi:hypothetical protein
MTLREFDKYGGTVAACVQALCKQRIAAGEEKGLDRKRYVLIIVSSTIIDSVECQKVASCHSGRTQPRGSPACEKSYVFQP